MYKEGFQYDDYSEYYQYRAPKYVSIEEKYVKLEPLLLVLDEYSFLLNDLHESSVSLAKLKNIQELLKRDIQFDSETFQLLNSREKIQSCFQEIDLDLVLEKRRIEFNLPVYYLCEYSTQHYFGDYNLILHDFYRNDYFKLQDKRFVPVTYSYTEKYALRLSQFLTAEAFSSFGEEQSAFEKIKRLGETLLQAMWDPQQFLAFQICQFFGMENLRQAIELIYLVNGTNVSVLRQLVDDSITKFFEVVYPHPYVVAYLKRIQNLDGREFKTIQTNALDLYGLLNESLSNLLNMEVIWGRGNTNQILYKVLFANLYRLEQCDEIKTDELMEKVNLLEAHIDKYVADIIT